MSAEEVVNGRWPVVRKLKISNPESPLTTDSSSTRRFSLSILLLGDVDRAEFQDARVSLSRWGTVHEYAGINTALAALREDEMAPDLIVVAQTFPGQFSHRAIDQLRRQTPLARIVGLMGSWCEGEMRTGMPWPAVVRIYWHQWAARCDRQLGRMANGVQCSWALPPTATEEERLLVDLADSRGQWQRNPTGISHGSGEVALPLTNPTLSALPPDRGLVVISAQSQEMAQWLSAVCRSRGYATVWQRSPVIPRVEGARAAVFDGNNLDREECEKLQHLATALRPAPVVALLPFPRTEDRDLARSVGAAAVISKPAAVDDLIWELEGSGERRNST